MPPSYDPDCYLCPGNARADGARNPAYESVHVFDNDFPALGGAAEASADDPLFRSGSARGRNRVVCFSPDHALTLPCLPQAAIRALVDVWAAESADLGRDHAWVQVFENKGAAMGCSNPHPHGQIWACDFLPDEPAREDERQRAWLAAHGRPMLLELAAKEAASGERVVASNAHWLAIVPYWASWPYEILLLPRFAVARMPELDEAARDALAAILKAVTTAYDNLFRTSFPYSMGWHGAPFGAEPHGWQLHAHFYPPLLRSASVRKFMVGFELLAEPQRDLTPEEAAARLRAAAGPHYLDAAG